MHEEFCRHCGAELLYLDKRADTQFCDVSCKQNFHTDRRRRERARKRAAGAIETIAELLSSPGEHATSALADLEALRDQINAALQHVHWKCRDCGQRRYIRPAPGDVCSFCQHDQFKLVLPAEPVKKG